jgi:hypothetical protein
MLNWIVEPENLEAKDESIVVACPFKIICRPVFIPCILKDTRFFCMPGGYCSC